MNVCVNICKLKHLKKRDTTKEIFEIHVCFIKNDNKQLDAYNLFDLH